MAVKELHIDLDSRPLQAEVVGSRRVLSQDVEGDWATSLKGQGIEFTGYRSYTYSDDASTIDWRASLRAKEILVREFEEYKNFNVVFVLDVSDTMLFTSTDKLKAEYGAEILFSLATAASEGGDAIGLAMTSHDLLASVQPSFGKGISEQFRKLLLNPEHYGGKKDFKKTVLKLNTILKDHAVIIFISDFLGLPKDWSKYLSLLAMQHHVIGLMLKDKRDQTLDGVSGQFFLKDPQSGESKYIDVKLYQKEYKQIAKEQEEYVVNVFKKLKGDCVKITNGEPYETSIRRFFESLSKRSER